MQLNLLGYEFPDTVSLLANGTFYMFATEKKIAYLAEAAAAAAAGGAVRVVTLPREKGDASVPANRRALDALIAAVTQSGGRLGHFAAEPPEGTSVAPWLEEAARAPGVALVDATKGAAAYLATLDEGGCAEARKAGLLVSRYMREVLVKDFEGVVNDERRVTHRAFADAAAATAGDRAALEKRRVALDTDDFELVCGPSVQSGGEGALGVLVPGREAVAPSGATLTSDIVILAAGMRYKALRAGCARTLMIDPTPKQCAVYDLVLRAHEALLKALVPGAVVGEVVTAARAALLAEPGLPLEAKMHKNWGLGCGARMGNEHLKLSTKSAVVIAPGMVFAVCSGLQGIVMSDKHPAEGAGVNRLESYAIAIGDTVLVTPEGPVVLTDRADRTRKAVSYEMAGVAEEEEEEEEADDADDEAARKRRREKKRAAAAAAAAVQGVEGAGRDRTGRSARLAEKAAAVDPDAAARRDENQLKYIERMRLERRKKKSKGDAGDASAADEEERGREIVAFSSQADLPPRARLNQLAVDKSREAVLVPWCGTLVPISILAIKSVVQQDEGDKHFLRLNLYSPQGALGKDCAPAMQGALARHPEASFIKTLNFMARDGRNFTAVEQGIKALLKKMRDRRKDEKETGGLVEQKPLTLIKGAPVKQIIDIDMWPPLGGRGKSQGALSCHTDGLLFVSNKGGEKVAIRFGNIKQGIYQPCEREDKALIHLHLRHPILIGKKKYADVQFYTELVQSEGLEQRGRSEFDPDEMGEEQKAKEYRDRVNREFLKFVRHVEDRASADPDNRGFTRVDTAITSEELQFQGAPFKEMSTVRLSAYCLFSVVDRPPLVVPISDIELVHFERVFFGGKSFDMIIVLKDGVAEPGAPQFVKIGQIEMRKLEDIKTWLDSLAELVFTESPMPLKWTEVIPDKVRKADFWEATDEDSGADKLPGVLCVLHTPEELLAEIEEEEEDEEEDAYESEEDEESEDDDDAVRLGARGGGRRRRRARGFILGLPTLTPAHPCLPFRRTTTSLTRTTTATTTTRTRTRRTTTRRPRCVFHFPHLHSPAPLCPALPPPPPTHTPHLLPTPPSARTGTRWRRRPPRPTRSARARARTTTTTTTSPRRSASERRLPRALEEKMQICYRKSLAPAAAAHHHGHQLAH